MLIAMHGSWTAESLRVSQVLDHAPPLRSHSVLRIVVDDVLGLSNLRPLAHHKVPPGLLLVSQCIYISMPELFFRVLNAKSNEQEYCIGNEA